MASKHEIWELRSMQASPLSVKIAMTKTRIREWVKEFGTDGVYVSFSGGKDSTVLLHIVREVMGYKEIPAMFVDTGLEYPEIRQFVKTFDNVDIVRPQMNFKQVIQKYGYPIISKETAEVVYNAKRYLKKLAEQETILDRQTDRQHSLPYEQFYRKLTGTGEYSKDYDRPSKPSKEQRQMDDALSRIVDVRDVRDTLAKEITGAYP